MKIYQGVDVIVLTFYLIVVNVQCLNYGYPVYYHPRYQQIPMASAPTSISRSLPPNSGMNRTPNAEVQRKPNRTSSSYIYYYPLTLPQSRGGKNLNVTLVSEYPQEQARILNQPDLYPIFTSLKPDIDNVPSSNLSPPLQQFSNVDKKTTLVSKSAPSSPAEKPFNVPQDILGSINKNSLVTTEKPEVPNSNLRQPKTVGYQGPPQLSNPIYIPPGLIGQKTYKNANSRYKVPPPQLYQMPTPAHQQSTARGWPCFCVPYYLCKNGVINSGGRSIATVPRKARSLPYNFTNKAYPSFIQPKVMGSYVVEKETDPAACESNKVCCRLSFEEEESDPDYYPVATPPPEPYYPIPPRFPEEMECGVRHAYGIQARLKQIPYPADVSEFGEYPWQAAVLRKIEGQKSLYLCGGVLISPQWVATAAHCVKKEQFLPLLIRLGEWDVNRKDELYPFVEIDVETVILHPDFNPDTLFNDIALIQMKIPVDVRVPHVTPACLPKRSIVYEDQKCWVSGWGKDFFGPQGEYQNILKEVDVPVLARDLCNSILRTTNLGPDFTLYPGFLCAGGEAGKDACTGDGGSPLVCISGQKWYVVGLVSWGIGCGHPGIPGIYINMLYYIDWINSIIWR